VSLFYNLSFVETDGIEGDRARKRNAKSFLLRVKMILWIIFRESVDRAYDRSTPLRRRGRGSPKDRAKSVTLQHTKSVSLFYNLSLVVADGIEGDRTLVVTRRIRQTHPVGAS